MAGLDCQTCVGGGEFLQVLASHGVEFLLSSEGKVPLSSCDGNMICLFFSANWCRPCRKFVPQLVELYNRLRRQGKKLEIVFISFDRDDDGFDEHFYSMPWLAVPYSVELHRQLSSMYNVNRIPFFVSLSSTEADQDLIGFIEDYGSEAFPFTVKRREELRSIDDAMRQGGKLEQLLAREGRDYVLSSDGRKVVVSELLGKTKTIGLYFGAHWCPPSRAFTTQLVEAYSELKQAGNQEFEIVLVSTDRDIKEFSINLRTMPWLAIPYEDRTRQDLCRIFNIKGIPALVIIGQDEKIVRTDGKSMISLYGAMAFPFTESRIVEIEAALKKEGDALPKLVKDVKHKHTLKLDMAKAYVCDSCREQGRFWAFSCDACDYDLHPSCVEEGDMPC